MLKINWNKQKIQDGLEQLGKDLIKERKKFFRKEKKEINMARRVIPEVDGYTKVQVISFLKVKIKTNMEWAKNACLAIYDQQTDKEKRNHFSMGHNNSGFGRNDSPLLTHIACKLRQNRATKEDIEKLQRKMPRYAAQLVCLAEIKNKCRGLKRHLDYYYKDNKQNMPF